MIRGRYELAHTLVIKAGTIETNHELPLAKEQPERLVDRLVACTTCNTWQLDHSHSPKPNSINYHTLRMTFVRPELLHSMRVRLILLKRCVLRDDEMIAVSVLDILAFLEIRCDLYRCVDNDVIYDISQIKATRLGVMYGSFFTR